MGRERMRCKLRYSCRVGFRRVCKSSMFFFYAFFFFFGWLDGLLSGFFINIGICLLDLFRLEGILHGLVR